MTVYSTGEIEYGVLWSEDLPLLELERDMKYFNLNSNRRDPMCSIEEEIEQRANMLNSLLNSD